MLYTVSLYFLLFIIYSFIGWIVETIFCYFCTKKLVDRGFLIGPICPIYGCGCLLIIVLLKKYYHDPIVLFVMAVVICSLLEYFTSYIMEKLFKARWWDYSDKKFNINGRICLETLISFGFLSMLMLYVINPFVFGFLTKINVLLLKIVSLIIFIIYLIDNIISFKIISSFKNVAKSIKKDSTEEITKKVKELLLKKGALYKRLVSAFNFKASERLLKDFKKKLKNEAGKARLKFNEEKQKISEKKSEIINDYKNKYKELKKEIKNEKIKKKEKLS